VLQEIENLTGSAFGDVLIGSALGNTLKGGAGNDYLVGNAGSDALYGGADNDIFRFETASFGNDVIADYQDGGDHISFGNLVATSFGQLSITGNGTTSVTVHILGESIVVQGLSPITLDASDFLFV
jgi:Ca2+-binding RTX toxin-like protein